MPKAVTFRLDEDLANSLKIYSVEYGVSQVWIVSKALELFFSSKCNTKQYKEIQNNTKSNTKQVLAIQNNTTNEDEQWI
jgi:predicted transcriptional regulator